MTNEPLTAEERLYLMGNGVYLPPIEAMDAWMEDNKPILDLVNMRVAKAMADADFQNPAMSSEIVVPMLAKIKALEAENKQLRKGKPIPHNGKEYWPDAHGWYEMECVDKKKWVLLFNGEIAKGKFKCRDCMPNTCLS